MTRVELITELEHIAARHWRGTEEDRLGGWLLRAADGFTGRANSALPHGDPGHAARRPGGRRVPRRRRAGRWLAGYPQKKRQPPVIRTVLMSAPEQAFASIRGDAGEVLATGRLSIADGWAGITAVEVTQARRGAGLGMALTRAICAEAAARGARRVFLQVETGNIPARTLPDPRPRRHAEGGVLQSWPGARYVCNHGYPCVQGLGSFAKRAGGR